MNASFQEHFANQLYSKERHLQLRSMLEERVHDAIEFRIMEAPFFCSLELRDTVARFAKELVLQSSSAAVMRKARRYLPSHADVPAETARPLFSVVDFALTEVDGHIVPKLIELQGFPSLFGYQLYLAQAIRHVYGFDASWSPLFSDVSEDDYCAMLRRCILADEHPDNVALMEIDPWKQKTRPDFVATREITGVDATDIKDVIVVNDTLFHERGGALHPLRRVYNRAIIDELEDLGARIPFSWTDTLNVQWAGHPNWYFLMSKATLPFLSHECVPHTSLVSELQHLPDDLSRYVLKPLFAFAGKGVNVNPTSSDIEAIPMQERASWILMEKVHYARCCFTPLGMNAVELRCMLMWPDGMEEPVPTINLVRSGRGSMMGARYNNEEWTGATVALFGNRTA